MNIDPEILAILSALEIDGGAVKITERLDPKTYKQVAKVLEACGGKWNRKAQATLFDGDAAERLDPVITGGQVTIPKNELEFFPTPAKLAAELVELADVRACDTVLEPSAGTGRLVDAILARGPEIQVFACERSLKMRQELRDRRLGDCQPAVADADDFMDTLPLGIDRVVMNPPFLKSGKGDHLDHVRHAFASLRHGGKLVSVLPRSVEFRRDKRYAVFRDWYDDWGGELTRLPEGSFKVSGTMVSTNVLMMTRP